ncbi:hypothetical protein [Caenispirillum salinarum]|uniref:hypothetical protein n=1 Tax=Caenispirillum salinarum TaxID=859058 RepID=UPI00384F0E5B
MISTDVIHSLFLPALRIKRGALPDRYTEMWFQAEETGRHHILCAEFCGNGHSRIRVPPETLVERGPPPTAPPCCR